MLNQSVLAIAIIACWSLQAQTNAAKPPCSEIEASQFDFWVGEWNLTWNDTITGTNVIAKEMGDCVIHENFSDPTSKFFGQSVSVYNPATKQWEQTWVDNQGSYMAFTGGFNEGKMTLSRSAIGKKGNKVMQRMVFFNITRSSLDWSWEASPDDGKTWNQNWLIHYKRK